MASWMKFTLLLITMPVWLTLVGCLGLLLVTAFASLIMSAM